MLGTVAGKYVHMYLGIKVYRCVSKHFLQQADRMADTLLRIEHHLTKSLDALRYDIGTVREEVRGLKGSRGKKVLIAIFAFLIYMQSTPDVSLSPESENGQLLNDYLRVDT